jgi:hypothetical protein
MRCEKSGSASSAKRAPETDNGLEAYQSESRFHAISPPKPNVENRAGLGGGIAKAAESTSFAISDREKLPRAKLPAPSGACKRPEQPEFSNSARQQLLRGPGVGQSNRRLKPAGGAA